MATVTFKNDIVCNLGGTEINVGDTAPVVTVVNCDPMLQDEQVGGEGKVQLVVAVPSLDTGVCDAETRRFNQEAQVLTVLRLSLFLWISLLQQPDGVAQQALRTSKYVLTLEIKILPTLMAYFLPMVLWQA